MIRIEVNGNPIGGLDRIDMYALSQEGNLVLQQEGCLPLQIPLEGNTGFLLAVEKIEKLYLEFENHINGGGRVFVLNFPGVQSAVCEEEVSDLERG